MTPEQALAIFRLDMNDTEPTYLWEDSELYRYLDDAQKNFCRWTDGINDASTTDVCAVPIAVDADWLDLHPSILKVRGATLRSTGAKVDLISYEDMATYGFRFDGTKGPVRRLVVGLEEDRVRCHPIASVADTLDMVVFRLPLQTVSEDTATDELEIPDRHHLALQLWMKSMAYSKQDSETLDRNKAVEFENKFRAYCAAAKLEQQNKKRHKPRTVAYGGL